MSKLLFRVWSDGDDEPQIVSFNQLVKGDHHLHPASYGIVEQCTGLRDRDGSLIFEGDIIELDDGSRMSVRFSFCQFKLTDGFLTYPILQMLCPAATGCKVVGNTHGDSE